MEYKTKENNREMLLGGLLKKIGTKATIFTLIGATTLYSLGCATTKTSKYDPWDSRRPVRIGREVKEEDKPWYKSKKVWGVIGIVAGGIIAAALDRDDDEEQKPSPPPKPPF